MALDDLDDLLESTLDDYLLALAQGIQEAQRQLDEVSVPGRPGQPATAYHLPRVDFELKMTFAMRGEQPAEDQPPPAGRARAGKLMLRPAARAGSENYSGEATSTIRGSFVAVPVTGGRAATVLRCSLIRRSARDIGLVVFVADSLGVPQVDVPVQANVDRERSAEFATPPGQPLFAATDVTVGLIRTDARGFAETSLKIADDEPAGAVVVVTLDAPGATETVMVQVTK
jgi:hypothetical protein